MLEFFDEHAELMQNFFDMMGFVLAICAVLIVWWNTHYTAYWTRFNHAAADLKSAFAKELRFLEIDIDRNPDAKAFMVLNDAFAKHQANVLEFRQILKGKQAQGFDQAWKAYLGQRPPLGDADTDYLADYLASTYEEEKAARELAYLRLKTLLGFAKTKRRRKRSSRR